MTQQCRVGVPVLRVLGDCSDGGTHERAEGVASALVMTLGGSRNQILPGSQALPLPSRPSASAALMKIRDL